MQICWKKIYFLFKSIFHYILLIFFPVDFSFFSRLYFQISEKHLHTKSPLLIFDALRTLSPITNIAFTYDDISKAFFSTLSESMRFIVIFVVLLTNATPSKSNLILTQVHSIDYNCYGFPFPAP